MTAQTPDKLTSYRADFQPGEWELYAVIRGEPTPNNHGWGDHDRVASFVPRAAPMSTTANHRGYTQSYVLRRDGALLLESVGYLDTGVDEHVGEILGGDFHLVLKSDFEGPRLYVPMRAGIIVPDFAAWRHEGYTGPSPIATTLRRGKHPDYPRRAKLWYEVVFDDGKPPRLP